MTKIIQTNSNKDYQLQYDWNNTFVQCNDSGVVLGKKPYKTAFFEAFPRNPDTFIRGEGSTIQEAETAAWNKYQKTLVCQNHEYKYHSDIGHGKCIHCNLFTSYALPNKICCSICKKQAYFWKINPEIKHKEINLCLEHFLKNVEDNILPQEINEDIDYDTLIYFEHALLNYFLYKEVFYSLNDKDFYFKEKEYEHIRNIIKYYSDFIFKKYDKIFTIGKSLETSRLVLSNKFFLQNHIKILVSDVDILNIEKKYSAISHNEILLRDLEKILKPFIL